VPVLSRSLNDGRRGHLARRMSLHGGPEIHAGRTPERTNGFTRTPETCHIATCRRRASQQGSSAGGQGTGPCSDRTRRRRADDTVTVDRSPRTAGTCSSPSSERGRDPSATPRHSAEGARETTTPQTQTRAARRRDTSANVDGSENTGAAQQHRTRFTSHRPGTSALIRFPTKPDAPRSSEPILIPKLRIQFADFPYLHYSID
jgi:hypothetical protein